MNHLLAAVEPHPGMTVTASVHNGATAAAGTVLAAVVVYAIWVARKHRSPVPPLFLRAITVG